ncbi:ROK family transcriptional regulator [Modestobacter sp. VKM Ac-2986]|uniref:ROK family transcriptional regulator n=1 Tax=Modestobacter sp. VKM Ac-2986 TaxID=3004140 RepID=UPI0022AAB994|nr:ROK family transcriptional regulator [Modestobacter sp. VKM Ac-2986]MCZ2828809.1 ROK family transcriptional regulator [Modestobacter sp. VKM Ac-2986]
MPSERFTGLVAVLDAIRSGPGITQPELTERVGLGRSVVAQRVGELESAGLVANDGLGPSTGGRAPRRLRLRAEAGHVLGVDIASNELVVGLADLAGDIVAVRHEHVDVTSGPELTLAAAERMGDALVREAGLTGGVWAVGVGTPGPVAFERGDFLAGPHMPGWARYPLRARLARHWSAPTWIDDRVNLLALGEMWRNPAAADAAQLLYVGGGTTIAAAVVVDGRVYRGANGLSGAIGHIPVAGSGDVVCACGQTGCLEAVAGGTALAQNARLLAECGQSDALLAVLRESGRIRPVDITMAAEAGDQAARALLHRTGLLLGDSLATLVSLFDPELLVIGGGMARAGAHVLPSIGEAVRARVSSTTGQRLRIELSAVDEEVAGVTGAVQLAVGELFSRDQLSSWLDDRSPAGRPELAGVDAEDLSA